MGFGSVVSQVCVQQSDSMEGLAGLTSALSRECPGRYQRKLASGPLWGLLQPISVISHPTHPTWALLCSALRCFLETQTQQDVAWSLSWRTGLVEKVLLPFFGTLGLQGYKEKI